MEKKSEILENFKTAIGSTVKSLSNTENVEVSFGNQNLQSKNISVKLPEIESAGSNLMSNELAITIKREGECFLNGSSVEKDSLSKVFASASQVSASVKVLIVADEEVPLKHVTQIVDLCRLNGISDFRLQSR